MIDNSLIKMKLTEKYMDYDEKRSSVKAMKYFIFSLLIFKYLCQCLNRKSPKKFHVQSVK